jgi:hypothetical protein
MYAPWRVDGGQHQRTSIRLQKTISRNDVVVSSAATVCNGREVEEAGAAWPTAKKDGGEGGEDAVEDGDGGKTG